MSLRQTEHQTQRNEGIGKREALLAFSAAMGSALLARELLKSGWRHAFDEEPPKNPASHEVAWKEALLWGGLSGACVGLVRIAARRAASDVYQRWDRRRAG